MNSSGRSSLRWVYLPSRRNEYRNELDHSRSLTCAVFRTSELMSYEREPSLSQCTGPAPDRRPATKWNRSFKKREAPREERLLTGGNQYNASTAIRLATFRVRLHHGQRGMLDGKKGTKSEVNGPSWLMLPNETYDRVFTRTFCMNSSVVMSCRGATDAIPA